MKNIANFVMVLLFFSSCTAFKPISKKSELTEAEFRAKITPGQTYLFELKSGQKLNVKVTEVDSANLYGVVKSMGEGKKEWEPFKDSFSGLYMNLSRAEVKKIQTIWTALLVASSAYVLGILVGVSILLLSSE